MAPPSNRRTTYSRKAQFATFIGYLAAVAGALAGAWFLIVAAANQTAFAGLRSAAADVTEPVAAAVATARGGLARFGDILAGYATWGDENARLRREVALARVRDAETQGLRGENLRLKALLALGNAEPRPVAHGWLIASSATSLRRFATISAGRHQGVQPGMPVRAADGLVGRVLEVGAISARVLLLTDSESVVPVRRARDGVPAFASGRGDGTMQLRLLTLGINPLKPGDVFVASGSGGLYWPGTPIAVVATLTRDGAIARLTADPAASEAVEVTPAWDPTADPSLPPPAPSVPPPPPRTHGKKAKAGTPPKAPPR